jgi:hypothetical protein
VCAGIHRHRMLDLQERPVLLEFQLPNPMRSDRASRCRHGLWDYRGRARLDPAQQTDRVSQSLDHVHLVDFPRHAVARTPRRLFAAFKSWMRACPTLKLSRLSSVPPSHPAHTHTRTYTAARIHTHARTRAYAYTRMHARLHVHTFMRTPAWMHATVDWRISTDPMISIA